MEHDREEKTPSTDLSGDFDMIVNEINEFITILEERGQELEQQAEESRHRSQQTQQTTEEEDSEECDTTPFQSARNTIILVENNEEPIYETCNEELENPYEAIPALKHLATATATSSANNPGKSQKPELKPKPKNLLKMVEPNSQNPRRVKALHNFKGTNNDEVGYMY